MTVDEAVALVLREGDPADELPETSMAVLLLLGRDFSNDSAHERITHLIEAIEMIRLAIKGQLSIDRRLTCALYTLGVGATVSKERPLADRERSDEFCLSSAIQDAFFDL